LGEPLSVVDILVASEPTEDRLTEQPAQLVARVPATALVEELLGPPAAIDTVMRLIAAVDRLQMGDPPA
jgi:hypothetical protein